MERGKKLDSVLKSREAEEHRVLQERMRVYKIFDDRQSALQEVERQYDRLQEQIERLEGPERCQALQSGDARVLASVNDYSGALRRKLSLLKVTLDQRREEFEKAGVRVALAEEDLVKARVERKKVETLIVSQERSQRIIDAALDESVQDEFSSQFHGNK